MTALEWDKIGERIYETGTDQGVLYLPDAGGDYVIGYAWNGLTTVTASPTGAESNKHYADNIPYLNLQSAEEWAGTIEAFTYPVQFEECDGSASPEPGVSFGQQVRKPFGFSYRSRVGNDLENTDFGYKRHLVYGCLASPSEKAYATINETPEPINFSWEVSTTPIPVGVVGGVEYKPLSTITIDSTKVDPDDLAELEAILHGTVGTDPRLPTPAEVVAIFSGALVEVLPNAPTYNAGTGVITIVATTGVEYKIDGEVVAAGAQPPITVNTLVTAEPIAGYKFPAVVDDEWFFDAP